MSRQDPNAAFAHSSFLYGGNAAYIDDLYARFERHPGSVDADWQEFFRALKDNGTDVQRAAHGPSWQRPDRLAAARSDLLSALAGDWEEIDRSLGGKLAARAQAAGIELSAANVQQATRDS